MDTDIFSARVEDTFNLTDKTSVPHFLGFLTEEQAAEALCILKRFHNSHFEFYGGFDSAERTLLCCMPDWCEKADYPISSVTVSYNSAYKLSHRDFLGSLMGLGIKRESVGDILCEDGCAVIFIRTEILSFVLSQLEKIGRVGVTVKEGYTLPLPATGTLLNFSTTVASLRLDCIVGALCGVSRNTATEYIESVLVLINGLPCDKVSKQISSGDSITVRGKGKFFITDTASQSKKERIILKYSKYA